MRRGSGLLGLIGVVLLLFAGVAALLTRAATVFDVVYIAAHGIVGLLALIAYLSTGVDNIRRLLGERSTRYGTSTALASLFFIAILTMLNFLAVRYHTRFDLTVEKVYSLSPQSVQVLNGLTKDLRIDAFVEAGVDPALEELLKTYRQTSSKVSYRLIDPDREPELAERYDIKTYDTVHLQYGESSSQVTGPAEETLTNAVIKLTRASSQTVCVVEGHGEPDLDDVEGAGGYAQLKKALENETYQVKTVLLATLDKVPDDCSVVLVAGPTRPYLAQELPLLDAYIKRGGRLLALLAPQRAAEVVKLLESYGVGVGDDAVVDQVVRIFQGPALGLAPLVDTYDKAHEITQALKGRTLFPMTRSVSADTVGRPGLKATELVKTSGSSWAETDLTALFERQEAVLDEQTDRRGPVPIALAVEIDLKQLGVPDGKDARLAVFGSSEFVDNRNIEGTFYNRDLFLNTVAWLVGQSDLVSIRPRSLRSSRVSFSEREGTAIFYLSVLVLPELMLFIGLVVWWRRE